MFGFSGFIVKTILIWTIISVVLVESGRQKRDVHHMIILKEDFQPLKGHRHNHYSHNRGRSKRKPPRKNKHEYSSSSEESFEVNSYESYEESRPHKPKSESHEHNHSHKHHRNNKNQRHKHRHSPKGNRIPPESQTFLNGKWISMTSQELFGNAHSHTPPEFPTTYQSGAMHFHEPVLMEITTAHPHFPNAFVHAFNNMNPQIHHQTLRQSPLSTVDTYKPFDYSILEQQNVIPKEHPIQESVDNGVASVQPSLAGAGTTFSIVLDNSENKIVDGMQKGNNETVNIKNNPNYKDNRMRGRNRFRFKRKGQQ